jgi:hypothetical protein
MRGAVGAPHSNGAQSIGAFRYVVDRCPRDMPFIRDGGLLASPRHRITAGSLRPVCDQTVSNARYLQGTSSLIERRA